VLDTVLQGSQWARSAIESCDQVAIQNPILIYLSEQSVNEVSSLVKEKRRKQRKKGNRDLK
jgi:hypothetical protein